MFNCLALFHLLILYQEPQKREGVSKWRRDHSSLIRPEFQ